MEKIEIKLENLKEKITSFYDVDMYRFVSVNAIDLIDSFEIHWVFIDKNYNFKVLYTILSYDRVVPSIKDIVPSAFISEMEIADLFGIDIEDTQKGAFLEPDMVAPLRSKCEKA